MIIPFITITLYFKEPVNILKVLGVIAIICGMGMLASGSGSNQSNSRKGVLLALLSFAIIGISQTILTASGYSSYSDPGNLRPFLAMVGGVPAAVILKWIWRDNSWRLPRKSLVIMGVLALVTILCLIIQFPTIDALSRANLAALFFPMAVGVCISVFTLAAGADGEKLNKSSIIGVIAIILGTVGFCLAVI